MALSRHGKCHSHACVKFCEVGYKVWLNIRYLSCILVCLCTNTWVRVTQGKVPLRIKISTISFAKNITILGKIALKITQYI